MANLKVNMSMTKNVMPEQDPVVRSGNFEGLQEFTLQKRMPGVSQNSALP